MPQAEANVVTQNLLVSTLRKEISWCNKARLRGASTSRARAKVWAQLPRAGPRAWGCKLQRLGAPAGLGRPGLGARAHGARAPRASPRGLGPGRRAADPKLSSFSSFCGRGLAKGWESAETAAADVGAWREAGTGYPPTPPPPTSQKPVSFKRLLGSARCLAWRKVIRLRFRLKRL